MCRCWVGADPGGEECLWIGVHRCHGLAALLDGLLVDQAVKRIVAEGEPLGLGVDAPMWWSTREGGGRKADDRLRVHYGIPSGTVQTANSLRGAALIGGVLLASQVRKEFPSTRITETHPKALLLAMNYSGEEFADEYGISADWRNEHERDAAIAAVCGREGFNGCWSTNLAERRYCLEQDPENYWLKPVTYFWPESI